MELPSFPEVTPPLSVGGTHNAAAVSAIAATSCQLKCPQCQALISLFASLAAQPGSISMRSDSSHSRYPESSHVETPPSQPITALTTVRSTETFSDGVPATGNPLTAAMDEERQKILEIRQAVTNKRVNAVPRQSVRQTTIASRASICPQPDVRRVPSSEAVMAPLAAQHVRVAGGHTIRVIPSHRKLNSLRSAFNPEVLQETERNLGYSLGEPTDYHQSVSAVEWGAVRPKDNSGGRKPSNNAAAGPVGKQKSPLVDREPATTKAPVSPKSPLAALVRFGSVVQTPFVATVEAPSLNVSAMNASTAFATVQASRGARVAEALSEYQNAMRTSVGNGLNPLLPPQGSIGDPAWLGLALNSPMSMGHGAGSNHVFSPQTSMRSDETGGFGGIEMRRLGASHRSSIFPTMSKSPLQNSTNRPKGFHDDAEGAPFIGLTAAPMVAVSSNSSVNKSTALATNNKADSMRRRHGVRIVVPSPDPQPASTQQPTGNRDEDDGSGEEEEGTSEDNPNASITAAVRRTSISGGASWLRFLKRLRYAISRAPALDDAGVMLQSMDVLYVISSVFLCCLALFLINAPSRPWLITDATGALVLLAQVFTIGWTILRYFVRNRDAKSSFVVNDTVGDTSKKYIRSAAFWLDLIVVIPVEWMVVPLLTQRDISWWAFTAGSNTTLSSLAGNYQAKLQWETTAAAFSFLMLRHLLRYWRIASLISSSNPIVSERSIFRFLTAVAIALAVVCTCAVAFQTWEGPTLAPLLSASQVAYKDDTASVLTNASTGNKGTVGAGFVDEGSSTTPVLFASFDALYWSMTTALTVGYGDITPRTPGGRAIAMLTMIVGTALLSTMTAIATSYFANKDPVQQELEERMRKMTSMLEYYEVPWELQRDVIASFPAVMEAHSRAAFLEMIENLPEICRNRVEGYSRLRLLRQIALFEGIEREHAFLLAKCLTQQFVAAQDTVVMQGELGNEMYFIVHGMLDVVVEIPASATKAREQIVVATLRDGAFFGERGLLHDAPRGASVVAITLTELLVLTRVDFEQVVCTIPEVLEVFRRNVFKQSPSSATALHSAPPSTSAAGAVQRPTEPERAPSAVPSDTSANAASANGASTAEAVEEDQAAARMPTLQMSSQS